MIAYKYNCLSGELVGQVECQENPLSPGEYLQPGNTTLVTPPVYEAPYIPVWDGSSWSLEEDHRQKLDEKGRKTGGTAYWLPEDSYTSEPRYMTELGPLPEGAVTVRPEKPEEVTAKEQLEATILEAKRYLDKTDYRVIKCAEQGLDLETEYPGLKAERQGKRDIINEAESLARAQGISITT